VVTTVADHLDEARSCLELAAETGSQSAAMAAVAHATLVLAEQQRVANLIAYLTLGVQDTAKVTDQAGLQQVADDIVNGLRITGYVGRFRS
jgi:hypothetical protein